MTDLPGNTSRPGAPDTPYRVLARKYRPGTFSELIGQEPMVRTLKNAIEQGRLAHAFILTGVRGVGKTTTARLIARAMNCIGPDGTGGPTVDPCGVCDHCVSIAESRHVDVLEMDAASRTGVDDIREIIEGVRYAPGSARFKIYIIDEVHMLSRNAFNALLKTLEEPPEHVKFVFATTEIRKVPVTVLSRCQRFDLRRVDMATLSDYFADIADKENVQIDAEALALIARAADGSVRDGLSLLDQAIAHGAGKADAEQVRAMLGLADRLLVMDMFEALMGGDIKTALANLQDQYNAGADPATIVQDLLELTHWVTQLKVAPDAAQATGVPEAERSFGLKMATKLSMPTLTRTWQMLLKGLEETRLAPLPLSAAEMAIIRVAFAADLPSPADLVRQITNENATAPATPAPTNGNGTPAQSTIQTTSAPSTATNSRPSAPAATKSIAPTQMAAPAENPIVEPTPDNPPIADIAQPQSFDEVIALCREKREPMLETHLVSNAHLVSFQQGRIELRLTGSAPPNLPNQLGQKLSEWTGTRWVLVTSRQEGAPTLREQARTREQQLHDEVSAHPLVKSALEMFPGAKITDVVEKGAEVILDPVSFESGEETRERDIDE